MLDERKSAILRAVVQTYIETAQPVGSGHVADAAHVGVSSATIRNELTHLEREGYLAQPHTSAGRIPTEKGYRFFVDHLDQPGLDPAHMRQVRSVFADAHGELEQLLRTASRILTRLTATTAVVVNDSADRESVRSVQLVSLSDTTALVVIVTSSGAVIKRSLEFSHTVDDADSSELNRRMSELLVGSSLSAISDRRVLLLSELRPELHDVAVTVFDSLVAESATEHSQVFIEGTPHIAGAFEAVDTVREVLDLLEHHVAVVELLRDVMDRGLSVAIGSETGITPLADCSVIVAPYVVGGERAGTIGVLGPTRMNYRDAMAAVAVVSHRLGKALTEG